MSKFRPVAAVSSRAAGESEPEGVAGGVARQTGGLEASQAAACLPCDCLEGAGCEEGGKESRTGGGVEGGSQARSRHAQQGGGLGEGGRVLHQLPPRHHLHQHTQHSPQDSAVPGRDPPGRQPGPQQPPGTAATAGPGPPAPAARRPRRGAKTPGAGSVGRAGRGWSAVTKLIIMYFFMQFLVIRENCIYSRWFFGRDLNCNNCNIMKTCQNCNKFI